MCKSWLNLACYKSSSRHPVNNYGQTPLNVDGPYIINVELKQHRLQQNHGPGALSLASAHQGGLITDVQVQTEPGMVQVQ